jgi:hypothetical protein
MSSAHRYTEAEVRAIFERAAARQESAQRAEDAAGPGLTLEELQEIGTAVGLDPAHVAAAADDVRAGGSKSERTTLLGMPVVLRRTRRVAGAVSDAVWEQMVFDLRRQFDTAGIAGEVGRQREWTTAPSGMRHSAPVRVSVEPEGAGSRITVEQTLRRTALPFAIVGAGYSAVALILGALLAAGALGSEGVFIPALFAAMALLMFGGAQVGFRLYAGRQERRFEAALDRLELIARDAAPAAAPDALPEATPSARPEAAPRLDLDSLPEPEPEPARRTSWRTRT